MLYVRHLILIVRQFIDSFKLSNNNELPKFEVYMFFLIPIVVGFLLVLYPSKGEIVFGNLLTAISIYMGFLVSMLIPFLNFIEVQDNYIKKTTQFESDEARIIYEEKKSRISQYRIMYSQVAFALLVSICSVILIFIFPSLETNLSNEKLFLKAYEISYGLCIVQFLKLLTFILCGINVLVLVLILVSSNVIIHPLLKKMNNSK